MFAIVKKVLVQFGLRQAAREQGLRREVAVVVDGRRILVDLSCPHHYSADVVAAATAIAEFNAVSDQKYAA